MKQSFLYRYIYFLSIEEVAISNMSNDKSFTTEPCAIFNLSLSHFLYTFVIGKIFFLQGTCYKNFSFRALQIHSRESKIVREKKIPNRLVRYQRDPSKSFKDRGKVESWKYCDQTTSNLDNVYRLTPL